MDNDILVAFIALVGTLVGTGGGIIISARLTLYRIKQLEKKMDKHNGLMERTYKLEERVCGVEDDVIRLRNNERRD